MPERGKRIHFSNRPFGWVDNKIGEEDEAANGHSDHVSGGRGDRGNWCTSGAGRYMHGMLRWTLHNLYMLRLLLD